MRPSSRKAGTALILLRCLQIGLSPADLDELTLGMVFDILTEKQNDGHEYEEQATQADIDAF